MGILSFNVTATAPPVIFTKYFPFSEGKITGYIKIQAVGRTETETETIYFVVCRLSIADSKKTAVR